MNADTKTIGDSISNNKQYNNNNNNNNKRDTDTGIIVLVENSYL